MHTTSLPFFESIPGPSPWYLTASTRTVRGFSWQSAGEKSPRAGKTLLVGPHGPVAILGFYNYVMPLDESSLLIWHQDRKEIVPTEPVRLLIVQPSLLSALGNNLDLHYERMNADRLAQVIGGKVVAEMTLSTVNIDDNLAAKFPAQLEAVDELLILCKTSAKVPTGREGNNLAIIMAIPKEGVYRLYPQDWYNTGPFDYMYQWVARVARNPRTGQIHGEGIRISPFVLDDSMRQLRSDIKELG